MASAACAAPLPVAAQVATPAAGASDHKQIGVDDARQILQEAQRTTEAAEKARLEVRESLKTAQDAVSTLERTTKTANEAAKLKSSFDEQWEAFKAKFDEMNKKAIEQFAGAMGVHAGAGGGGGPRPAEYITEARAAQALCRARRVVVLTGAGISAESGVPTFRGADGFWTVGSKNYQPQELATWRKFNEMPEELWRWYQYRWRICTKAKPNPGHHAVVELDGLKDGGVTLVTQNVDGLHRVAGSPEGRLFEIHGRIDQMRCDEWVEGSCLHGLAVDSDGNIEKARATVVATPEPAENEKEERVPVCSACGVRQRPKILWFDESYNEAFFHWKTIQKAVEECDVLLIVGTQLCTGGPGRMVQMARSSGAIIIRLDTEVDLNDPSSAGMLHMKGKSGEVLPKIVAELRLLQAEPALAPLLSRPSSAAGARPSIPQAGRASVTATERTPAARKNSMPATRSLAGRSPSRSTPLARASAVGMERGSPRTPGGRSSSTPASRGAADRSPPATPPAARAVAGGVERPAPKSMAARSSSTPASRKSVRSSASAAESRRTFAAAAAVSLGSGGENGSSSRTPSKPQSRADSSGTTRAPSQTRAASSAVAAAPSANRDQPAEGFFVYGTLRPDDDSGASWTQAFSKGMLAEPAVLPSASMYVHGSYPAVCFEQTRCTVRGVLLTPSGSDAAFMASKLAEADRIEGYPDLYQRAVAKVVTAQGEVRRAYVYHRTGLFPREESVRLADGDWLSRKRS